MYREGMISPYPTSPHSRVLKEGTHWVTGVKGISKK